MPIELTSIPDAFEVRLALPRPNWETIDVWLQANVDDKDPDEVWTALALQWLELLQNSLGNNYGVQTSENFFVLSASDFWATDRWVRWCECYRERIIETLPGVARDEGYGKQVLIAFHDHETYYDYVADFYADEGEFALSGGMFIDQGYGHLAVCATSEYQLDHTIAHELTHAMLRHLPLPPWLNEGATQVIADLVVGTSTFVINREIVQQHRSYWNEDTIHSFWSGDSFHSPDDGQRLSYNLAEVLFRNLLSDYPRKVCDFLNAASWADAGEQALLETCGTSLADRATQFLGPGNWAPRSDYLETEPNSANHPD